MQGMDCCSKYPDYRHHTMTITAGVDGVARSAAEVGEETAMSGVSSRLQSSSRAPYSNSRNAAEQSAMLEATGYYSPATPSPSSVSSSIASSTAFDGQHQETARYQSLHQRLCSTPAASPAGKFPLNPVSSSSLVAAAVSAAPFVYPAFEGYGVPYSGHHHNHYPHSFAYHSVYGGAGGAGYGNVSARNSAGYLSQHYHTAHTHYDMSAYNRRTMTPTTGFVRRSYPYQQHLQQPGHGNAATSPYLRNIYEQQQQMLPSNSVHYSNTRNNAHHMSPHPQNWYAFGHSSTNLQQPHHLEMHHHQHHRDFSPPYHSFSGRSGASVYKPYSPGGDSDAHHYYHQSNPYSRSGTTLSIGDSQAPQLIHQQMQNNPHIINCSAQRSSLSDLAPINYDRIPCVALSSSSSAASSLSSMGEGSADNREQISANDHVTRPSSCSSHQQQQHLPPSSANSDCLTISSPMTSGSGTDSGISTCSTSTTRSESTTSSTPGYSADYPMSVGSLSHQQQHQNEARCLNSDQKDIEEITTVEQKEEIEVEDDEEHAVDYSRTTERKNCTAMASSRMEKMSTLEDITSTRASTSADETASTSTDDTDLQDLKTTAVSGKSSPHGTEIDQDSKTLNSSHTSEKSGVSYSNSTSHRTLEGTTLSSTSSSLSTSLTTTRMNTSPIVERSATLFIEFSPSYPFQQQQQLHHRYTPNTLHSNISNSSNNNSSWSPFPSSPNSWSHQFSPKISRKRSQSPPPVTTVPHNSPVEQLQSVFLANKNRIVECDFIPSKKSKRKSSIDPDDSSYEVRELIQDITPLPGFQQTFGSTEIGRFSETFLSTPESPFDHHQQLLPIFGGNSQADVETSADDTLSPQQQWETSDSLDDGEAAAPQYNLRIGASLQSVVCSSPSIDRRHAMQDSQRGANYFSEIRCNGY